MSSPSSPSAISSIAACTRCRIVNSQLDPSNSGLPSFRRTTDDFFCSAVGSFFGEELMNHRKDLGAVADPLHREMAVRRRHLTVGAPKVALARHAAVAAVADLDIGEVLAERQYLAAEQLDAMAAVGAVIVAVRGLGGVDVPGVERVALAGDAQHLLERGRDDGAAGLAAVEEGLLIDLLGRAGMADEDDVDGAVAPLEEDMEQHEEALCEILHRLRHRAGDVHQAEHHRLRVLPRHAIDAGVADIDGIDLCDELGAAEQRLDLGLQTRYGGGIAPGLGLVELLLDRLQLFRLRPAQRDAARHAVAHGTANAEAGGRAGDREAGALEVGRARLLQRLLDEVRQLEILEKHVEELFLGEGEFEGILARAVGTALRTAAAAAVGRPRNLIADDIFLVAGNDIFAPSRAPRMPEGRLVDSLGRDRHLLAAADIGDLALAQRILDRRFQLRPCARDEALAVAEALALPIRAAVDDVH